MVVMGGIFLDFCMGLLLVGQKSNKNHGRVEVDILYILL